MSGFNELMSAICSAVAARDGHRLAQLLDVRSPHVREAVSQAARAPDALMRQLYQQLPESPLQEALVEHHWSLLAFVQDNHHRACQHQEKIVGHFSRAYREEESPWLMRVLICITHNYRAVAAAADRPALAAGKAPMALEACGSQLQKYFSLAMGRTGDAGKRLASLEVLVTLFRVYFAINNLRLCKNLISAVESRQFPPMAAFPASQRVTYKYFLGRIQLYDEHYEEAMASLQYALEHCHPQAVSNRRAILFYLIPLAMLHARLPSAQLLAECCFPSYDILTQALREGNLKALEGELEACQYAAIQAGTFLLLEKLHTLALRRLLKRTQLVHAQLDPPKGHLLPLGAFQAALSWQGQESDLDEVECLIANLIQRGLVKGYISHSQRTLVLSKVQAFPPCSEHPPLGSL